jgi:hypothetical protein
VTLSHGSKTRQARLEEVTDRLGAPVVAAYHAGESFSRPYMDVPADPTVEDFESRPGIKGRSSVSRCRITGSSSAGI